jgi:hypothetical protein
MECFRVSVVQESAQDVFDQDRISRTFAKLLEKSAPIGDIRG